MISVINNTAAHLVAQVISRIEDAYAPNTMRAYRADWKFFLPFCEARDALALPASPETVAAYIAALMDAGLKSATIRRKANSIAAIHRWSDLPNPVDHVEVQLALRKMYRRLGRHSRQALGLTSELMERLIAATTNDLRGLRDRALLRLAYETLCRRQELVSLRAEDMHVSSDDSAAILLRRSKTDWDGGGKWIFVTGKTIACLREWLDAADITEGPIFRGVTVHGRLTDGLHPGYIPTLFKSLARRAGLDRNQVRLISGHSPRVGAAQDLMLAGASLPQIMVRGRWKKTDTVMRYVERLGPASVMAASGRD